MQIEDILSNNIFIFFRWVITIAAILVYGFVASFNLQILHTQWKKKRVRDTSPTPSMIMVNFLIVAAIACPFSSQSDIAGPFWIIMFFVDPGSWIWLALPFLLMRVIFEMLRNIFIWTLWPVRYLWKQLK